MFLLLEQVNAGWVMKKKKKIGTQIYRKKNEEVSLDKDTGSLFELHVFYKHNANESTQPEIKGKFKHNQSIIVSLEGY